MYQELKDIAIRKFIAALAGATPTLDSSNDVEVGAFVIDSDTNKIWQCVDNTLGAPQYVQTRGEIDDEASSEDLDKTWSAAKIIAEIGAIPAPSTVIDDEAGSEDLALTWSASKIIEELEALPLPSSVIDDEAGSEDLDKTWSASKIIEELTGVQTSAGVINLPTIVPFDDEGTPKVTIGDFTIATFADADFNLPLTIHSVPEDTYTLTDESINYVIFTGSTGLVTVTPDRSSINQSTVIPIVSIYAENGSFHTLNWDELGKGLANKLTDRMVRTTRFEVETGGLILGEIAVPAVRTITVTGGYVWAGATRHLLDPFISSSDTCMLHYHVAGVWTQGAITQYNNLQYDDGTDLQTLTTGTRYAVNWIFRGVEDDKCVAIVLGTDNYNKANAEASTVPAVNDLIATQFILVGRILVAKGQDTAYAVQSAFAIPFNRTPVTDHDQLANLQGGVPTEYYHLTEDEHTAVPELIAERTLTHRTTGFSNNTDIDVAYNPSNKTIELTGTFKGYYEGVAVDELEDSWESDPHEEGSASPVVPMYLKYNGTAFSWSEDPWAFTEMQIAYAYFDASGFRFAQREVHGFQDPSSHESEHWTIGTYKRLGGDLIPLSYTLGSTTAANRRPDVNETTIKDEDLPSILPALTSKAYTQTYLSGAGAVSTFVEDAADILPLNGNIPYYNQYTGGAWQQTPMSNNQYMCVWLMAVPTTSDTQSQKYRYMWIQGQSQGSLSSQQALTPLSLSLGSLQAIATEAIITCKIILRYTSANWALTSSDNVTGTRAMQIVSPAGTYLSQVYTDDSTILGNGTVGDPLRANVIDDEAGSEDLDKTWSASKIIEELGNWPVNNAILYYTAGENLSVGDVCYLKSEGKMWRTDATAETTAKGLIAMAMANITAEATGSFLKQGTYTTTGLTVGAEYYLTTSAGTLSVTKPSSVGNIVRFVGYALSTTVLDFCPDKTYIEIA
jgi:hypothetical protein